MERLHDGFLESRFQTPTVRISIYFVHYKWSLPLLGTQKYKLLTLTSRYILLNRSSSFLEELLRPKNGIRVQSLTNLGILTRGQKLEFQISLENSGQIETSLVEFKTTGHHDSWIEKPKLCPVTIQPGQTLPLTFRIEAKSFGKNKILMVFNFCLQDDKAESFGIGSQICVEVKDQVNMS